MFPALLAAVALAAPVGFHESPALERITAFVAHNQTPVYCADTVGNLENVAAEEGLSASADVTGLTEWTPLSIYLHPVVCKVVLALENRKPIGSPLLQADDALALVHESIHASGIHDEGQTECAAMHHLPGVAVRFLHVKPGKKLRAFMALAWKAHRLKPAVYQMVC